MNSKLINLGGSSGLFITSFTQVTNTTDVYMTVTVAGSEGAQYELTQVAGTQTIPASGVNTHVIYWSRPTCSNQSSNTSSTITVLEGTEIAAGVPTTVTSSSVNGTTASGSGTPPSVSPSSGNFVLAQGDSVTLTFSGGTNVYRILGRISGSSRSTYYNGWTKSIYNGGNGSWTISWKAAGASSTAIYMNYYYNTCISGFSAGFLGINVSTI